MQTYPIDTQTLGLIEVAVFGVLEGLRYNNYKKTGSVSHVAAAVVVVVVVVSMSS